MSAWHYIDHIVWYQIISHWIVTFSCIIEFDFDGLYRSVWYCIEFEMMWRHSISYEMIYAMSSWCVSGEKNSSEGDLTSSSGSTYFDVCTSGDFIFTDLQKFYKSGWHGSLTKECGAHWHSRNYCSIPSKSKR